MLKYTNHDLPCLLGHDIIPIHSELAAVNHKWDCASWQVDKTEIGGMEDGGKDV